MLELQILSKLILAGVLGALLGLEVETRTQYATLAEQQEQKRQTLGGVRTYSLVAFLGAISSLFYYNNLAIISYMVFLALITVIAIAYGINAYTNKAFGITGEFSLLLSALVGFIAFSNLVQPPVLIALVLLLTFILSQKQGIAKVANSIAHNELQDVLKFGIMLLIVAPFLPNVEVTLGSVANVSADLSGIILFNPAKLWQYLIIISGLSILGYFAIKVLGTRLGALVSGVFSGLISSTATVIAFATKSKQENTAQPWASAAVVAHSVSFIQFAILSITISGSFFSILLPLFLSFAISSLVIGGYKIIRPSKSEPTHTMEKRAVFLLTDAVEFTLLVVFFRFLVQFLNVVFGPMVGVIAIVASGFTGMDVALVTMGDQWLLGLLPTSTLLIVFVLTNLVNFAAKSLYAKFYGNAGYASYLTKALIVSGVVGVVVLILTLLSK